MNLIRTEGTDYTTIKAGFISVSVLELTYKSALRINDTPNDSGKQQQEQSSLQTKIIYSNAAEFINTAMILRRPCIGGTFNAYGVDEAATLAWKADIAKEQESAKSK